MEQGLSLESSQTASRCCPAIETVVRVLVHHSTSIPRRAVIGLCIFLKPTVLTSYNPRVCWHSFCEHQSDGAKKHGEGCAASDVVGSPVPSMVVRYNRYVRFWSLRYAALLELWTACLRCGPICSAFVMTNSTKRRAV